jgi:SAM-dependent methyltransferase
MLLGDKVSLYGVGQKVDEKFESYMAPYIKECVNTELDPFYNKSNEKIHIPYDDGKFNAVIATEILEHLISPLELIAEASRILAPGGIFIMTTPNISHIGAVCKLLLGRSNHERLDRSPMYLQNNLWRGHIRFYDKKELNTLFERNGLTMIHHKYYIDKGWSHAKWPMLKRLIISLMDKIAPIYRDGHFAVFKKQ